MANRLELVYNIKELLKEHTDDSLVSDRHIMFLYDMYRTKMLRQLYSNRSKALDSSAVQAMCLEMEEIDKGLCGITVNCKVFRSKQKLPSLLSLRSRSALVGAAPSFFGSKKFEIIDREDVEVHQEDKYSGDAIYFQDGYAVAVAGEVDNAMLIECIRFEGVFDKPSELEEYSNCCGCDATAEPCLSDDTEYPIPGHLLSDVSQLVLNDLLGSKRIEQIRDTDNDSVPASKEIPYNGRSRRSR
jgi:hypothetical protein